MAAQRSSNAFEVKVDGTPLRPEIAGALVEAFVEDELNLPDAFELVFRDPLRTVLEAGGFEIGKKLSIAVVSEAAPGGTPILDGEITARRGGDRARPHGDDRARLRPVAPPAAGDDHRDPPRRHVRRHRRQGRPAARPAARRAAAPTPSSTRRSCSGTRPTGSSCPGWPPRSATRSSSSTASCTCASRATRRRGRAPATCSAADARKLVVGGNVLRLRATVSGAEQVEEVQVRGWDYKEKAGGRGHGQGDRRVAQRGGRHRVGDARREARRRHARQGRLARRERRGRPARRRLARRAARQRRRRARRRGPRQPRAARRRHDQPGRAPARRSTASTC